MNFGRSTHYTEQWTGPTGSPHQSNRSRPVQPAAYSGQTAPAGQRSPKTEDACAAARRRRSRRRGSERRQGRTGIGPAGLGGLRARGSGAGTRPRARGDERAASRVPGCGSTQIEKGSGWGGGVRHDEAHCDLDSSWGWAEKGWRREWRSSGGRVWVVDGSSLDSVQ